MPTTDGSGKPPDIAAGAAESQPNNPPTTPASSRRESYEERMARFEASYQPPPSFDELMASFGFDGPNGLANAISDGFRGLLSPRPATGADASLLGVMTPDEVAAQLRISPEAVIKLLAHGQLRGFEIAGEWRTTVDALKQFVEEQLSPREPDERDHSDDCNNA